MAGATKTIALAVDVLNVSLRHPFLLAGQLAVAQAASGGRVEVGLGAGSHEPASTTRLSCGHSHPCGNGSNGLHVAASPSRRSGAARQ
jgi:alkanesulfonate monooxygenase SsuD/methylene tetrahydromethanopterin reductase-like flavin-dependent oxidoreductase (luciferase family)